MSERRREISGARLALLQRADARTAEWPASGRPRGEGRILAYLDDDVVLAPTWHGAIREAFSDPSVALVGGPSFPHFEVDPPSWLAAFWVVTEKGRRCGELSLIDHGSAIVEADPLYVWGLNFAIRKSAFEDCGGFHPDCIPKALQRYQGDGETGLSLKIKSKGLRTLYHPAQR